jgi:hypothetical protein
LRKGRACITSPRELGLMTRIFIKIFYHSRNEFNHQ